MGIHNKFGDLYHKHLYSHITRGTAKITDSTKYAISDIVVALGLYSKELIVADSVLLAGLISYALLKNDKNLSPDLIKGFYQGGIIVGISTAGFFTNYGINLMRTPLENKLGLELKDNIDMEKELDYTIKKLNELSKYETLSFEDVNNKVNECIDDFVLENEGYKVYHSKRIKKSIFSKKLIRKTLGGIMNPYLQEIIVTSEKLPEFIAHEKAHLVGYARENEAEFVGFASMLNSDNIYLNYLAYLIRIQRICDHFEIKLQDLEKRNLNTRTFDDIKLRENELNNELSKRSRYEKSSAKIDNKIHGGILKIFGQKNIEEAYFVKPLRMMSAYDPPEI